jgi:type II secretory pathway predicted ATPase ExeA
MYTSFYGMSCNPFLKDESIKYPFESNDYIQTINRFHYLKEIRGIGLITGSPGVGKTYSVRSFINSLNKDLYKVIYLSGSKEWTVFDFFKIIANKLNLDTGPCYRADIYNNIQKEIKRLITQDHIQPIIIIDEAHLLSREILQNFKVFYDFEMDSKDYVTLILVGIQELKGELSKNVYEPLKQRIIVNYSFNGLSREEVKSYITSRLELSNTDTEIFSPEAINSLYSCCKSLPRRLNTLIINSLMLGFQNKITTLDSEIVMNAKNEMDLI